MIQMRHSFICCCLPLFVFTLLPQYCYPQLIQITSSSANEYHPKWSPSGEIIAFTKRTASNVTIWLTPIHQYKPDQIKTNCTGDLAFSWSPDGKKIVFDAYKENRPPSDLYIYNIADAKVDTLTHLAGPENHPSWSPDGSKIAFTRGGDIWTINTSGRGLTQMTTHPSDDWHPAWSPDGSQIVFTSDRSGNHDLWIIYLIDGSIKQLTTDTARDDRACWSPDASMIAFGSDRTGNFDIWIIKLTDSSLEQITSNPSFDSHPDWSPDGSQIAFASQRSGNLDVWIKEISVTR